MAMKAVLLSSGVVLAGVMLKASVPVVTSQVPLVWSLALSWVQPPYLYLLINCIILSILASSKLHPCAGHDSSLAPVNADRGDVEVVFGYVDADEKPPLMPAETAGVGQVEREVETTVDAGESDDGEAEFVVSRSMWTPPKRDANEYSKPPVSARFGHRRAVKASPKGKSILGVSRPKRQETLGSTWRTITEGRPMPLTRHLRKSETYVGSGDASPVRVMKKSETFAGGNSSHSPGSGRVARKEVSLSQDELNRRVEAFINKFNEEMRMQRQESLNQYRHKVGHH